MKKIIILMILAVILSSQAAYSKTNWLLFWYPGGAGSAAEAQPYLDAFTSYLNEKDSSVQLKALYVNDENAGSKFIADSKPIAAIISYPLWIKIRSTLKDAQKWLTCKPLPAGTVFEKYTLAYASSTPSAIYSSFPLSTEFGKMIFKDFPAGAKFVQTRRMLATLKTIAEGSGDWAILTADEAASLKSIKSEWKAKLKLRESTPVSAALFVTFGNGATTLQKLKGILTSMESDPEAADILVELRLKGFAESR